MTIKHHPIWKYFTNASWLIGENILKVAMGIFVSAYFAQYLGPTILGKLNFTLAIILVMSIFADVGIRLIIIRDIVREPHRTDEIISSAFIIKFAGGLLGFTISVLLIHFLRTDDRLQMAITVILSISYFCQAFDVIEYWFQSQILAKFTVRIRMISLLISSFFKLWCIFSKASLLLISLSFLTEYILVVWGLIFIFRKFNRAILFQQAKIQTIKSLLYSSWPVWLSSFVIFVQIYIDHIMLGQLVGDYEVGQYSVAWNLINSLGFFTLAIINSVAPALTKTKIHNPKLYHDRFLNNYRLMFIITLAMTIPIFFFKELIITHLYGSQYINAIGLMSWLLFRIFFANFSAMKYIFFVNENLYIYSLVIETLGLFLKITLNYQLIPMYHAYGAIYSSIITYIFTIFIADAFYHKTRPNLTNMLHAILTPWKIRIL